MIRERAFVLAVQRLSACTIQELFFALPVLEKVTYSGRRDADKLQDLKKQIEHLVEKELRRAADKELDAVCRYEITVKNAVYRLVNQNRVLAREQLERLLLAEKAGYGKHRIAPV